MEMLLGALAQFAEVDEGGLLSITKNFNALGAKHFPFPMPDLYIGARVSRGFGDVPGYKAMKITFVDADGNEMNTGRSSYG